jgi:hypothetical protein
MNNDEGQHNDWEDDRLNSHRVHKFSYKNVCLITHTLTSLDFPASWDSIYKNVIALLTYQGGLASSY